MGKVLIVYDSRTGNTERMSEAVEQGVRSTGVEVVRKKVDEVDADELEGYDGIIVGTPCYYGLMSAALKQLIDESVVLHGRLEGKVGAAFSSSANVGGGNETAVLSILQAMLIHGMVVQGASHGDHYGPVAIGSPDERSRRQCEELGRRVGNLVKRLHG